MKKLLAAILVASIVACIIAGSIAIIVIVVDFIAYICTPVIAGDILVYGFSAFLMIGATYIVLQDMRPSWWTKL